MTRKNDNKRAFYVVQFIELPFESIDDYVCVPNTWLIVRKATDDKVVVAYPKDEDPFDTRDRVKRKERYNDEWRFYLASIKYESNSYSDAEFWIATRNDYGPLVEEKSKPTKLPQKPSVNEKFLNAIQNRMSESNDNFRKPLPILSIKRPGKSISKKEIEEKRLKQDESAPSSSAVVNNAKVETRSSKRKQSVIILDNQSMECCPTEESSVASYADKSTEPRSKTPRTEQTEQTLSSSVTDVDKRTKVINIDDEDHSQLVKKPDQNNSMSQANPSSNTTDVSMTAAKPSTAAEQSTQPNQYNHQEYIPDRSSLSNFQLQIKNVRSLANVDDHKQLVHDVPCQKLSTSYEGLDSLKISAHLYRHMNGGRRLIPIQKQVEKKLRPTKMERNLAIATQNPSNSIDQTRHLLTRSVEQPPVVTQNQSQNDPRVSRTHTGNNRDQIARLRSIGMTPQEINGTRMNLKTPTDLAAVDPRNVFQSVNNAAAISQQLSSLSHNPPSYIRVSDGHQNSVAHEQYYAHSYQNQYLPTNRDNLQQERVQGSSESNTYDHRPTSQTINMRIPSIRQNSIHFSNPTYQTPEFAQQKQMQPNQLDSQQQPQRPKLRIGISIKPKNRKQMPSLQGVTKKTPPPILTNALNSIRQKLSTTHNDFLLNNPQLQARMSPRFTGENNVDLTTSPQNIIASETSERQNTEWPGHPIYQPSRIQHTTAHENRYQNLYRQEQIVNHSTQTNSETKRVPFMDDATGLSVTGSHLNVMENACQTDECMVDETLSPYHAVTSDSDAVTDQEVISDHEMSTDEAPAETTNNVYGTANDPGHGSADRPTAAQNSTSTNHQTHRKIILEQQMLDNFATLFTQMGSTLCYTTDMYNTLRSSILDTAKTYKKLLGAVEQFNTAGNAASNASPSINLRPESPRSPEERHTKVTPSASFSNQDQHSNDVANKTPKKKHNKLYRFVLPPEYDAYDTRWTLKYRSNLPGLVELMPQSGVYVSYGDLKYCQQVSKDCKSLARRLLPQVFNRNALSVCSSMSEKAQASNNVGSTIRPDLDDHACSVLLNFVLQHGLQRGWNTDLQPILSTLHSKMQEIRFKYGVMVEC
ncbi:GSCOCT00013056001.2-RA-CDS [Cotesia congregata]|uniref:Cc_ben.8_20.2 n=2 Tax=root TaxID=1 RepID=S6D4P6_COTCN|nr:hypothetical protein CcBV_20.2 [Bracoviriform congregatae]CAD6243401.1 GSCOCT00013056001.2-RA-CDS [Cotesia congregata]CAG17475.1 hypothetical protein CcBV_20.2 [Bracoviriform congregatae]CAG5092376.1 cc_ben.8_20.2 [Cotesia congregata]CCQ71117.1 hypothetical protein BEN-8 [Cotesia congregata]